jgi:hypothetical protein
MMQEGEEGEADPGKPPREVPGYSSRTKVMASWSEQEIKKTATPDLVPTLPDRQLLPVFSPCLTVLPPSLLPRTRCQIPEHPQTLTQIPCSPPIPVLTGPWEPSGAQIP